MKKSEILLFDDNPEILRFFEQIKLTDFYNLKITDQPINAASIIQNNEIKIILSSLAFAKQYQNFFNQIADSSPDILLIIFIPPINDSLSDEIEMTGHIFQNIQFPLNKRHILSSLEKAVIFYDLNQENKKLLNSTQSKLQSLEIVNRQIRSVYESQMIMSSTISHELRTPLAAIKMAIDIVLSGTPGTLSPDQKRFLKKAKDNIDRLKRLIDQVLDVTKLETGKTDFNFKYNNINKSIKDVVSSQELVASDKGLFIKMKLDENMIKIPFDEDKIAQVFNNLIGNAIKFTNKGGINISSRCNKFRNFVEIIISDTGIGIAKEDIPKLFQNFSQLGDQDTRKSGGTGLGLSICDKIIKSHGGKIWVKSKLGKGTKMILNLPIEERRKFL